MVVRTDDSASNDCERNALTRLLPELPRKHPRLRTAVLLDELQGRVPQVRILRELGMNFIIGTKGQDAVLLHDLDEVKIGTQEIPDPYGTLHCFRRPSGAEPEDSNSDILANVLSCSQFTPERSVYRVGDGRQIVETKTIRFNWISGLRIGRRTPMPLMHANRTRRRVRNVIINTMRNQGPALSHNFDNGKRNPIAA